MKTFESKVLILALRLQTLLSSKHGLRRTRFGFLWTPENFVEIRWNLINLNFQKIELLANSSWNFQLGSLDLNYFCRFQVFPDWIMDRAGKHWLQPVSGFSKT